MQYYSDSIIQLEFDIYGMTIDAQYTVEITSSVNIQHNVSNTTVYSVGNNHVSIAIKVLESNPVHMLDDLEYESISICLVNSDGKSDYCIELTLLSTQHGVFTSCANEESLFTEFSIWLLDNEYIEEAYYEAVIEKHHTATSISNPNSGIQTYSTTDTTYTPQSMYIAYGIEPYNDNANLDVAIYVYWVDVTGNIHPARFVNVELYDADSGNEDDLLATGTTNVNGHFIVSVANQTFESENGGCDLRAYIYAENKYARVFESLITKKSHYFIANCGNNISTQRYGYITYGGEDSNISRAFSVLDAVYTGGLYVKAMSGTDMEAFEMQYPNSTVLVNHYNKLSGLIYIDEDDFGNWDAVLHEYGHYVADVYGIYPFVAMEHVIGENQIDYCLEHVVPSITGLKYDATALAWQEGWANYFSVSAQIHQNTSRMGIGGVGNIGLFGQDIEIEKNTAHNVNSPGKGEACELAITRVLWDMADTSTTTGSSDGDPIEWGFATVWKYTTESGADTFSEFMSSIYSRFSKTSSTYQNLGRLLYKQQISARLLSGSVTTTQVIFLWDETYSNTNVRNTYVFCIYDLYMNKIYEANLGTTTSYTLNGSLWTSIQSQYSDGVYVFVKTTPALYVTNPDFMYSTGPYYSNFIKISI